MKCQQCKENEGEVSVLDEFGDVQLYRFSCADRRDLELLQSQTESGGDHVQ